jgi:transposase, IS5 family
LARKPQKKRYRGNCIEGKFGEGKRRYSLDQMMTKLSNTSETAIAITFLVMNLSALLRRIIMTFFVSI